MEMKVVNVLCVLTIIYSCLVAEGQQQCMKELGFCISYLNNTSQPPDTCCQPLDYIVKSLPDCFCNLISLLGVNGVGSAAVDAAKAQALPARCGQRINPLQCITGRQDAGSNNSAPNSANSRLLDSSFFITTMAVSSIILNILV